MTKKYYPGANTPNGYVSFFDKIISWSEANRIIIIKGGPGVGKSTFMKNLVRNLKKNNIELELLYCTSDSNSLDGLILVDYDIAILDGTAPHIIDPKYPGCIDEIINFGSFWNEVGIKKHKQEIVYTRKRISKLYKGAYNYLKAAKIILNDSKDIYTSTMDICQVRRLIQEIYNDVFRNSQAKSGNQRIRQMFASAITADGCVDHLDSLFGNVNNRYIIKGPYSIGKSILMENIFNFVKQSGFNADIFLNPMDPTNIEHILIYDLNCSFITFTSSNELNLIKNSDKIFNLDIYLSLNKSQKQIIEYNNAIYNKLLNRSIELLNKTKTLHNQLESIYAANMEFKHVDDIMFNVLEKIKKYIK